MLITLEGFDHIDTATPSISIQEKWNHPDAASGIVIDTSITPADRGNSISLAGGAYLRYEFTGNGLPQNLASGIIGFHWRNDNLIKGIGTQIVGVEGTGTLSEWRLQYDGDQLELERFNDFIARSSPYVLKDNTWYHFEIQWYIGNSIPANSFIVKIDGWEWINLPAGTDTQHSPTLTAERVNWNSPGGVDKRWIDDVYFVTLTGVEPTSFLSSSHVQTLFPTGDSTPIDFLGSDGNKVDNYLQVDEASPDEDTTYNQISSDGRDQYGFPILSGTVTTVHGIELCSRARSNQASPTRHWNNYSFVSGTNYDEPTGTINNTSYDFFNDVLGRNPDTNGPWSVSSVNDAEYGVKYTT